MDNWIQGSFERSSLGFAVRLLASGGNGRCWGVDFGLEGVEDMMMGIGWGFSCEGKEGLEGTFDQNRTDVQNSQLPTLFFMIRVWCLVQIHWPTTFCVYS